MAGLLPLDNAYNGLKENKKKRPQRAGQKKKKARGEKTRTKIQDKVPKPHQID